MEIKQENFNDLDKLIRFIYGEKNNNFNKMNDTLEKNKKNFHEAMEQSMSVSPRNYLNLTEKDIYMSLPDDIRSLVSRHDLIMIKNKIINSLLNIKSKIMKEEIQKFENDFKNKNRKNLKKLANKKEAIQYLISGAHVVPEEVKNDGYLFYNNGIFYFYLSNELRYIPININQFREDTKWFLLCPNSQK